MISERVIRNYTLSRSEKKKGKKICKAGRNASEKPISELVAKKWLSGWVVREGSRHLREN